MTRLIAFLFATLVLALAGTLWLRDAVQARREAARAALEQAAELDLSEAARGAAEAGLDLIVEYLPPDGPVVAARSSVVLPSPAPEPRPAPARAPAPKPPPPVVERAEIVEEAVVDQRSEPFFESHDGRSEALVLGEDTLDEDVDALPSVATGPTRRTDLIRRLLNVYDRLKDDR